MPKKALSDHQMKMVYQLCDKDGISQAKVAQLYDVSQGTISNALKEMRFLDNINQLNTTLENGFTRGVQAAIEDGTFSSINPIGLIDTRPDE